LKYFFQHRRRVHHFPYPHADLPFIFSESISCQKVNKLFHFLPRRQVRLIQVNQLLQLNKVLLDVFQYGKIESVTASEMVIDRRQIHTCCPAYFLACHGSESFLCNELTRAFDDFFFGFPPVHTASVFLIFFHCNSFILIYA